MRKIKKYFKVTDPKTGEVRRSIGWRIEQDVTPVVRILIGETEDGEPVWDSREQDQAVHSYGFEPPLGVEITKKEFDKISVDHPALGFLEDKLEGLGKKKYNETTDWLAEKVKGH